MRPPLKSVVAALLVLALVAYPPPPAYAQSDACPSEPPWARDLCVSIESSLSALLAEFRVVIQVIQAVSRAIEEVARIIDTLLQIVRSRGRYRLRGFLSLDAVHRLVQELLPHMPNAMAELSRAFQNPDLIHEWFMQQQKTWAGKMPQLFRTVHAQLVHGWSEESPDVYRKSLAVHFADPAAILQTLTQDLLQAVPEEFREIAQRYFRSLTDPAHSLVEQEKFLEETLLDVAVRHLLPLGDPKVDPEKFRRAVRDLFDAMSLQRARTDIHQTVRTVAIFESQAEKRMSQGDLTLEEYINYSLQANLMSARASAQTAEMTRILADRIIEASTPPPPLESPESDASGFLSQSLAEDFSPRERP